MSPGTLEEAAVLIKNWSGSYHYFIVIFQSILGPLFVLLIAYGIFYYLSDTHTVGAKNGFYLPDTWPFILIYILSAAVGITGIPKAISSRRKIVDLFVKKEYKKIVNLYGRFYLDAKERARYRI